MKEHHKQEIFATRRALKKEEMEAFIKEMMGEDVVSEMMEDKREESKDDNGLEWAI